ncbi:MAG: NADP-dependent phosphogluconate dehydrogenase, partial [Cytophagaceae bacterium]
ARIINHHIGFSILQEKSKESNWQLDLKEIARIWTSGCIIRSGLMEDLSVLLDNESPLLLNNEVIKRMNKSSSSLTELVTFGLTNSHPAHALSGALNYFLSFKTENSPANLIQAQRDYFGSHTYKRVDYPENHFFHTEWKSPDHG